MVAGAYNRSLCDSRTPACGTVYRPLCGARATITLPCGVGWGGDLLAPVPMSVSSQTVNCEFVVRYEGAHVL